MPKGPYRVVPGDVLELQMPRIVDQQVPTDAIVAGGNQSCKCRISDEGTIVLPLIGSFPVAGRSLSEIDLSVMAQYYPKYIKKPLPIHVAVSEYSTRKVAIVGAVTRPGVYALRHDQMSLIALLMEAGGIAQNGASVIRIMRSTRNHSALSSERHTPQVGRPQMRPSVTTAAWRNSSAPLAENGTTSVLPVKGLNIPFADVALEEGDSVVVERPVEQFVSVVGLVNRPANMPYPPDAQYNLIQAIAFAGGLDLTADPRYVSVYRLRPDGTISAVTVQLVNPHDEQDLTESLVLPVRPGDVVSVEHTPRTRTNVFFDRVFRISLGLYLDPESLWEND